MTSVALCTYNGEKYIEEQISSILNQSVPVDEIVVCDDGSADNTLTIIDGFQSRSKTNIRIYRNEKQLGVCANFQKAVDLCTGDIIFLSDQDDVWHPDKVKIICEWFDNNPQKNVVFTNAYLIDDAGQLIPDDSLWRRVKFSRTEQFWFNYGFALEVFIRGNVAVGGTMAIRENRKTFCSVISETPIYHDKIIAVDALIDNSLGYITKPLIQYRLHDLQISGLATMPIQRISAIRPFWYFVGREYVPSIDRIKNRIQFGEERLHSKHTWFGLFVINNLSNYWDIYGFKCGMIAVTVDFFESVGHSIFRILNKIRC